MPQERVGELVLEILTCWCGNIEDGERALAPLRALATPVADALAPIPYPAIYKFTEHLGAPHGVSIRSMFADDLSYATIDASLEAVRNSPSLVSGANHI